MNATHREHHTNDIAGIHHITAVAGDPVRNWRFYTQVLGERMVKKTVNFDDPGTYHLYYGDQQGSPGSILTFFPWAGMRPAQRGGNQITATTYAVAESSLDFWSDRLRELKVDTRTFERFGESGLAFADPDSMPVEIIGSATPPDTPHWQDSPVPESHRLRGFHSATASVTSSAASLALLTDVFGMTVTGEEEPRTRLAFTGDNAGGPGGLLDLVGISSPGPGGLGAGSVHHIAFRARDLDHEAEIRERVQAFGLHPTTHIDRDYFMSVYFREPSGILYEIATDPPGFTRDEPLESLGESLRLPRQHEHLREQLEGSLTPLPPVNA
jgi:glyoxalase family protein